ncbi:MAG TPA: hypothetical protein PKH79_06095 [Prolixibacteraceae bacterium]|mgnify:CR=1 FL=1|nr:hypothetical protein [Prolixibacteraceae bacterium]
MEPRRFSEAQHKINQQRAKMNGIVSQIMLLLGAFILVFGLIYIMMNLSQSDSVLWIWICMMITGIALILFSFLIKGKKEKHSLLQRHKHSQLIS